MRPLFLLVIVLCLKSLAINTQSIRFDQQIGDESARKVIEDTGLYNEQHKTEYIRQIGERLLAELSEPLFEYKFYMVPEPAPNAFALPGGYVFVTTGLIPIHGILIHRYVCDDDFYKGIYSNYNTAYQTICPVWSSCLQGSLPAFP